MRRRTVRRVLVSVKRCTRWDIYPSEEPAELCEVVVLGSTAIADALGEQYPRWRAAPPVFDSITELEGPCERRYVEVAAS